MKNKKQLTIVLLLPLICFITCKNKEADSEATAYQIKGDTVYVSGNNILASKIKLSDVEIESHSKEVITAGTVQPIPTQFAYIAPPFSGRIIKSYIKLGQTIKANTPLFEIISPDFTATQKDFFQARSSRELAQKELKRKKDLIKNGVGSQKELEEALSALQIAEKEYENSYAALLVYQINPENMVLGQSLTVRSPISGYIIENNIVTGQYIKDDSEPIAIVADLSQVWITAQVKEKDIRFIHEGDNIEMHMSAYPEKIISGKVFHIEEAVDEATRSIKVLSICENKEQLLKIGMYCTIHFLHKASDFIHIPETALLQGEKDSYIYTEIAANTYLRTPVEVEALKNGKAVISKGLDAGSKIISEGGYYLK
ncbi:efflux RND transporter periplasmic adaptor subunit [Dysgonomonas macrotermitis]|uniref:Membrane fusion protein, cobalt-zinc-cadmium efflux system n=1 Tax=Dysgonomonas macrotermitis TaxID=1346286 RepID=A0A1M5BQ01_9BACT|nr:efflux RND transporter periplasmic adaptor subunit [Dysgonomonas macrotermitis]SHF44614.1 membrane fusion protein, cobalt-zinc-cadmium efflux system [Dysgonomonas macrotermitis]